LFTISSFLRNFIFFLIFQIVTLYFFFHKFQLFAFFYKNFYQFTNWLLVLTIFFFSLFKFSNSRYYFFYFFQVSSLTSSILQNNQQSMERKRKKLSSNVFIFALSFLSFFLQKNKNTIKLNEHLICKIIPFFHFFAFVFFFSTHFINTWIFPWKRKTKKYPWFFFGVFAILCENQFSHHLKQTISFSFFSKLMWLFAIVDYYFSWIFTFSFIYFFQKI
jgi:hypothetical protein